MAPTETSSLAQHAASAQSHRGNDKMAYASKPAILARQPLAPKNSMPQPVSADGSLKSKDVDSGSSERSIVTPQQQHRVAQARLLAGGSLVSANSGSTPVAHRHTTYQPSPLGLHHRDESSRASTSQLPSAHTPRKRNAPFDEIQQNRLALRIADTSSTESTHSNKRSRSSKTDSSLPIDIASTSTSTGAGLVSAVHDAHLLDSQGHSQESLVTDSRVDEQSEEGENVVSTSATASRKATAQGPPPRPKTTRIDKKSRMTEADRAKRDEARQASQMEWRRRFIKAFPAFRFYLDGFDTAGKDEVTATIHKLGASVEPFFSNTVTHLVTARRVSLPLPSEGSISENREVKAATENATYSRSANLVTSLRKKQVQIPLHSDRNPFEDSAPPVSPNDILVKARSFGIKVWTFDKFFSVIKGLVGGIPVANQDKQQQLSLSQMLEKEKLQGSLDRDPNAVRNDYHYFSRNSIYLLIEDSTAEHRPIMLQEWNKPASGTNNDDVPWPVLHGELEGRCPFTKYDFEGDPQKRVKPNRHETLRRSVSLNHSRTQQQRVASLSPAPSGDSRGGYSVVRGASPYPLASGNSMSIASGVASTTSTAVNSAVGSASGVGLLSPFGPLGRQINQSTGLGLGRPSTLPTNQARLAQRAGHLSPYIDGAQGDMPASLMRRSFNLPNGLASRFANARSVSTPNAGESLQREKKPGYCENCRVKYEDFEEHVAGRRHRKFAKDDSNFAEIDELLNRNSRPIAAWASAAAVTDSGAQTPASSQGRDGRESGIETSPSSSLVAAGGSLDEAYARLYERQGENEARDHDITATQASLQSVKESVTHWQQDTAERIDAEDGEDTFIDHDAFLNLHDDQEEEDDDVQTNPTLPLHEAEGSIASRDTGSTGIKTTGSHRVDESPETSIVHEIHEMKGIGEGSVRNDEVMIKHLEGNRGTPA